MEELSTQQHNLIKFLYNETSMSEDLALQCEMSFDTFLLDEYELLRTAKQALPKALFNPSDAVLDNILRYSRTTAPEHHC